MKRKLIAIILTLLIIMTGTLPVFGDTLPGPEKYQITVTSAGGIFDFNGITAHFKKDCLGRGMESITFDVSIYAEGGTPYIEFGPSIEKFDKKVLIKVERGERDFYDIATGKTITIFLDRYNFHADHFSRLVVID